MLSTEIGYTTVESITVRERNLANELIGRIDFVEMIFLMIEGRACTAQEKDMVNALLVAITDHGLTPSALAARLTYTGSPEAPQAAIAAGLLGAGSVFLGAMSDAAEMLVEFAAGLPGEPGIGREVDVDPNDLAKRAEEYVRLRRADQRRIHGLGHNIHVNGDPRVPALRDVAERNGFDGFWWRLLDALQRAAAGASARPLPLNTAGATAACVLEMGLPPTMARGLALIARTAGLVAHVLEENERPIGRDLWSLVLRQDPRNELP